MKYKVLLHSNFEKEFKLLAKKFPSLKADVQNIIDNIEHELQLATDLGDGFKKIRLKIKSKGKGSAGGGRIISYETIVSVNEKEVLLGSIYNKGEYGTVDIKILKEILGIQTQLKSSK